MAPRPHAADDHVPAFASVRMMDAAPIPAPLPPPGCVITLRTGDRKHLEDVSVSRAKFIRHQNGVIKLIGPKNEKIEIRGKDIKKIESVPDFLK